MSNTSTLTANTTIVAAPVTKTSTREIKAKLERLRDLRAIKTAADKESKELSAEILAFAGPLTKFVVWGKTKLATIVDSHSTTCDLKALAQAFPEAFSATVTVKPYKQVR